MKLSNRALPRAVAAAAIAFALLPGARAESPMHTDDAGTLPLGGMKIEAIWSKDDKARGGDLLFAFSPITDLELEIAAARVMDGSASPDTRLRTVGLGAKWVPFQNDTGWSLGARLDVGQTRIDDYEMASRYTERETAITGLATYRLDNGQVLHLNLGALRLKTPDEHDTLGFWGIGYEFPLRDDLQLTLETYGVQKSRPDQAIGLRYEVFDGFKVSGAIGRGQDRGFGLVSVAWEF